MRLEILFRRRKCKMRVFFGAGKSGRRWLEFFRECNLEVDYFVDNNHSLYGMWVEGIEIISIKKLISLPDNIEVIITCKDDENVFNQLLSLGIEEWQILRVNSIIKIFEYIWKQPEFRLPIYIPERSGGAGNRVIFDLSNGIVLGGVEFWSIKTAKELDKIGYSTALLVAGNSSYIDENKIDKNITIKFLESLLDWNTIEGLLQFMIEGTYNNLICNFVGFNLEVACLAKKLYPNSVQLITVVHNDEEIYYKSYMEREQYIDKCLVISSKMENLMLEMGFPKEKLEYLLWEIPCEKGISRFYSPYGKAMQIGYAGRIVKEQKRMDLVILLAEKLNQLKIDFIMELAGNGTYEAIMREEIKKKNLESRVQFVGTLIHDKMMDFWKGQDIMISCSDFEGHSISQGEAMASGVVPVITNVSGAIDDVIDGYNGFIVDIGDIETLTKRIYYLYYNRDILKQMGLHAHNSVFNRQIKMNQLTFWDDLLKKA